MRRRPPKIYRAYQGRAKGGRKALAAAGIVLAVITLLLLACFVNHRIRLGTESRLLTPPGTMVEVAGKQMHVYTEGSGAETLVFLSGGGDMRPGTGLQIPLFPAERRLPGRRGGKIRLWLQRGQRGPLP